MKTPSVFGRGGLDELTAVDFSPPLAWLLVSPPRTPSSLAFSERARGWAVDLWLVVAWAHYGFVSFFFLGTITGLSRTEAQRTIFAGLAGRQRMDNARMVAVFSFLYFLKIKISKIYIRFEIFQK